LCGTTGINFHFLIYPPTPAAQGACKGKGISDIVGSSQSSGRGSSSGSSESSSSSSSKSTGSSAAASNVYPPTPADGKGERVREERLWTTRNTTTVLGKLSKVAEQQQQQGATNKRFY